MSSHRADSCSDKDTRKSRAVRLGAVLLAVVGVTAAATSAGFSNDAWFSASADAGTIQLQGSLDGENWTDADSDGEGVVISIPADRFANMVPGDTRSVTVHLHNDSTVPVVVDKKLTVTGPLLTDDATTTSLVFDGAANEQTVTLAASSDTADTDDTSATLTITAEDWGNDLQGSLSSANTATLKFTGTAVPNTSGN